MLFTVIWADRPCLRDSFAWPYQSDTQAFHTGPSGVDVRDEMPAGDYRVLRYRVRGGMNSPPENMVEVYDSSDVQLP
jgi:hypothetical protein